MIVFLALALDFCVALLLLVYIAYASLRTGIGAGSLRRHRAYKATIDVLRTEIRRLRDENAGLRGKPSG
jgi:hypothetical protein